MSTHPWLVIYTDDQLTTILKGAQTTAGTARLACDYALATQARRLQTAVTIELSLREMAAAQNADRQLTIEG